MFIHIIPESFWCWNIYDHDKDHIFFLVCRPALNCLVKLLAVIPGYRYKLWCVIFCFVAHFQGNMYCYCCSPTHVVIQVILSIIYLLLFLYLWLSIIVVRQLYIMSAVVNVLNMQCYFKRWQSDPNGDTFVMYYVYMCSNVKEYTIIEKGKKGIFFHLVSGKV